ncbi:MAG: 6-phosphogluconolactonase [Gemmatimonadaceae bacterium]|nr:6-phosphogluconolactonase [Gemmatimonadaceae bacterium]
MSPDPTTHDPELSASMARTPMRILPTPDDIGQYVAARMLRQITDSARDGRRCLLGLPTGRTPRPIYAALARMLAARPQSLSHVTLVMMDEYLVESVDGFTYAMASGAPSCHDFTRTEIVGQLNAALPDTCHLAEHQVWFPEPRNPDRYDDDIRDAGGIDFFLAASGAGDGHVAFNPPGSALDSRSRVIMLSEQTRRDNLQTFPALGSLGNVPRYGVSVGIATIIASREVVMVAWGEGKRTTVARMRAATRYEPDWPATLIHECARGEIVVDIAAAS